MTMQLTLSPKQDEENSGNTSCQINLGITIPGLVYKLNADFVHVVNSTFGSLLWQ